MAAAVRSCGDAFTGSVARANGALTQRIACVALAVLAASAPSAAAAQPGWAIEVTVTEGPLDDSEARTALEGIVDEVAACAPGAGPYRLGYTVSVAPSGRVRSAAPDRAAVADLAPSRAVRCVRHILEELELPELAEGSRLIVAFAAGPSETPRDTGPPTSGASTTVDPESSASTPASDPVPSTNAPPSEGLATVLEPAASGAAEGEGVADEGEAEEADAHDWLDDLTLRGHVDVYVAAHWPLPRPFEANQGPALAHRAYDLNGGVTLAFVGLDAQYAPRPIGATVRLRFGSAVWRLILNTTGLPDVLQFLYEAYASWRPVDEVQIDFGEFVTPFGAEVAESWLNQNYTRGSLYNVVQPFYHVGFRLVINPAPWITITLLAVNGWNNFVDNNDGKSGAVQLAFHAGPLNFSLGYMLGPEGAVVTNAADPTDFDDENSEMRHFADAVVTLDLGDFDLVANGDFYADNSVDMMGVSQFDYLWGAMLGARYQIIPELGVAARGEYIGHPNVDQAAGRDLVTVTGTLDLTPIEHIVVRLDGRADIGTSPRFVDTAGTGHDWVFSTILGVVVHTD